MTQGPTAWLLFREGLSVILDAVGVVLLLWLGLLGAFGANQPFETKTLWVGAIGALAAVMAPSARRKLPIPMLAYVGIAVLSAVLHQWPAVARESDPDRLALFAPASHLITMLIFVLGSAHLLRTPRRLAVFAVLFVASISLLAVQILYDRATLDFVYLRDGSVSMPHVAQWGGLHQIGMLLVLALPFPAAHVLMPDSLWQKAAGITIAAALLLVALVNGSTGGIVVMPLVGVAMVAAIVISGIRGGWRRAAAGAAILAVPIGFLAAVASGRIPFVYHGDLAGRLPIWRAAAEICRDHFWLGVGPGGYSNAMVNGGYAARNLSGVGGIEQAHNMLLQVGAETGIPGALFFAALWLWLFAVCWKAWAKGPMPLVALGLLFALTGFFIRSMSDSFLDGLVTSDRTRVLVWMVFAAALAVSRLPRTQVLAPTRGGGRRFATLTLACVALVAVEAYMVFLDRVDTFSITGNQVYDVTEFAKGGTVSHAFLMRGDGMRSVSVRFSSTAASSVPIEWTLWRGYPDGPAEMTRAFGGVEVVDLRPGRQWKTWSFPRDGSSHDRWYTIQLRLVEARPSPSPQVSIVASHNNPDRGGVLWVNDVRQPGSLWLRAERRGRSLYRQFQLEVEPNLPELIKLPVVLWGIVAVFHWALAMFAYTALSEGCRASGVAL